MIIKNGKTVSSIYKGNQVIEKIYKGTLVVYESFKNLIASGVPPLTLNKCKGVDLVDYKLYGESVQGKLPSEYQQVEYLESSATQYIDTAFYPDSNSAIEIEALVKTVSYNQNNYIFGVTSSSDNSKRLGLNLYYSTTTWTLEAYPRFSIHSPASGSSQLKLINFEQWYNFRLDKGNYYVDNELIASYSDTFEKNEYPLYINTYNNNGSAITTYIGNTKIKSCKIWDNGVLARDFIPCYRKSDNVAGMYDLVTNTLFTNAGTGEFIVGSNTPTPEAPIEIESVGDKTKNLFDINTIYATSNMSSIIDGEKATFTVGSANSSGAFYYKIPTIKGKTYTVSCKSIDDGAYGTYYKNYGLMVSSKYDANVYDYGRVCINTNLKATFTATTDYAYIHAYANWSSTEGDYFSFEGLQVEEGTEATPYEPYGYKIPVKVSNGIEEITTNIYLNEPLRKINDYADYIDFEKKQVTRVVKELICNGTEDWKLLNGGLDLGYYYLIIGIYGYIVPNNGLNTHLEQKTISSTVVNANVIGYNAINSSTYNQARILIRPVTNMKDYTNTTEWVAYLKEQYNLGTPMKMYYVLTTPEIEENVELPNIPTLKGTTILSVDTKIQPSNLEVVYKGK